MNTEINRTVAAVGLLAEIREHDVDAALTSRSPEDLRRRASSGMKRPSPELTRRRREPEPVAA